MFVFPVFALAYGALLWRERRPWRTTPRAHAVAGVILLFFALPFLYDFTRGRESNVAVIWAHLQEYNHTH